MFIGAENIISPLGKNAKENFINIKNGETSLKTKGECCISSFLEPTKTLLPLIIKSISDSSLLINEKYLTDNKTLLIVSTTKGDINHIKTSLEDALLHNLSQKIKKKFKFINKSIVVSTACISGIQSLIIANDMINHNYYDNVIICSGDLASDFVIEGFTSFYALSDVNCRPFDRNRSGLNIGEAVSTIIMSKHQNIFKTTPFNFLGGCSVNDANHISAPHKDAKGLIQSIKNTLEICKIESKEIDFINAHGTATLYNDAMESKAFTSLGFDNIPINSLKGFFGHTLGTAGLIETAICLQSMRNNIALKCKGYKNQDSNYKLNILTKNLKIEFNTLLKTSSGFGGFNASIIIQKI